MNVCVRVCARVYVCVKKTSFETFKNLKHLLAFEIKK